MAYDANLGTLLRTCDAIGAPGHDLFTSTATLGILQVTVESAVYGVLMLSVARASAWFSRSVVRRRLEAVTGAVLVGLGIRLALTKRP